LLIGHRIETDHFIPWAKYPLDLAHNFVLSHSRCNNAKSDNLAVEGFISKWISQAERLPEGVMGLCRNAGISVNLTRSARIVHWAYSQSRARNALAWLPPDKLSPIGDYWRLPLLPYLN
jgi:hypothetical protein